MTVVTVSNPTRLTDRLLIGFFRQSSHTMEQTSSHFVELPSSLPITDDQQTTLDYEMVALETAVVVNDPATFLHTYENMDWEQRPAQHFLQAIDLALQIEAHLIARNLARRGSHLYPKNAELQKANRILAPPRTTIITTKTTIDIVANHNWLKNNRKQYQGKWVALRNGELLACAQIRNEVEAEIGELKNSGILLTKVY